jgi:two-component system osmolarity sensor histidine kinase EnvZ
VKFRFHTLLGRTALFLGVLMLISQALWLGIAAYFFVRPIDRVYRQNISMVVSLARTQVEQGPVDGEFTPNAYFRIVRDSAPRPEFKETADKFLAEMTATLRSQFGESVAIRKELDNSALWIRFPVGHENFWAVVPKGAPPIPHFMLASVGIGIAVALAGAYIIIFNLTKRLRTLTDAVQAFGRGEPTIPMEEAGPLEIMNLSRGFNQMAVDLKKLDDDRRFMLAGISHDLKTPLTRLRLAVELAGPGAEPELAAGMVHDIEDMDSILKQFLDYARDGAEEQPALSDLNVIVEDVCERYRASGHEIESRLGQIPPVPLRKLAIYRAATNLVDNAVRYGRSGIHVETLADGESVSIVVTDSGPGIKTGDPSDYVKAFVRENLSRSEPGAGLGLAIVGRIARIHGGNLHLENRATGGLLARIDLPREKFRG